MMIPLLGNLVTLARPSTEPATDLTPVLFVVTSALWIWIDQHRRELQAVPISTRHVVSALPDAVIVVDGQGHLVDANPAALQLLAAAPRAPGAPRRVVGEHWRDVAAAELADTLEVMGHSMVTTPSGTVLDVRTTPLLAPDASVIGAVVVARHVSELERLRAELAELAVRDALTGLFNRRHLEAAVSDAVLLADTDGDGLSAVMIDIDHFKEFNDRYGHAVGDEVLASVAHDIATALGPGVVARFGGEEFVALLPGLDAAQAAERVTRWRCDLSGAYVGTSAGPLPVTVSAGVAQHCAGGTAAALLAAADAALYAAKAAGRDRVVVAVASGVTG